MTLKQYRVTHDLTLADLAAEIGCSVSTLSLIERGLRRPKFLLTQSIIAASKGKIKARDLHPEFV